MPTQLEHELAVCRFIRGAPGALYDIGVGPKSEWRSLALAYPRMRVCGCEPHPAQHEALRKAKFPGPLMKVAIGEQEGVATLHREEPCSASSR
jgi:hypothetical protein